MTTGLSTVIFPVRDLERAKALYGALLDSTPVMDEAYYVGFDVAGQDVGLDPHGHAQGMTGPVGYWHVDDLEKRLQALLDAGPNSASRSATSVGAS
jgi:catechol 2,3-dioxygenase-like lactoylglutathione lyase family enzyme